MAMYILANSKKETSNGRIYSKEVMESIIEQFMNYNVLFGPVQDDGQIPLSEVSFKVKGLEIYRQPDDSHNLAAYIDFLDTPNGLILQELHKHRAQFKFYLVGTGEIERFYDPADNMNLTSGIKNYKFLGLGLDIDESLLPKKNFS